MISHNWSPMKRLIWLRGSGITGGAGTYETITGNPVSFTALNAPLKQLSVAFSPVQAGTGDPSPDNVRPISGWDSLTVYHSGADTSDPQTISITIGQTVYSGTVDVVTGVVTVTHRYFTLTGSTSGLSKQQIGSTGHYRIRFYTSGAKNPGANKAFNGVCDTYKPTATDNVYRREMGIGIQAGDVAFFYDPQFDSADVTLDDVKTWLNSNNVHLVYERAAPLTIQLTPQEVSSLLGENNMWSNANGDLTVTYAADPATTPIVGTGKVGQAIIGG